MKTIKFTKAVATGNDFVVVDNRRAVLGPRPGEFAKKVCEQKRSVGADGLLLLEPSLAADFKMRIFNPDGSEAEMCGNGSRCIALYARENGIAGSAMKIETIAGILDARVRGENVKLKLPEPKDIRWNLCLMIHKCPYKVTFVDTGVPHVVHFADDLDRIDVKDLGSHIRHHKEFSPQGANADFVRIINSHNIMIRTYERGVEDETLACGTGAVAGALISAEAEKLRSPIMVETRGGEKLKVYFKTVDGDFRDVYLEGRTRLVFEGTLYQ